MDSLSLITLAAEGSITDFRIVTWIVAIVVFVAALTIAKVGIWPKITEALDARDEKILSEIKGAEDARIRADEALKDYEKSLAEARAEANELIEKTKAEQSRLAAQLRAESEAELNDLRSAARRDIDAAKRAAVAEVYAEAANIGTAIASKILEREVNADDHRRLVEETLNEIGSSNKAEPQPA